MTTKNKIILNGDYIRYDKNENRKYNIICEQFCLFKFKFHECVQVNPS